MNDYHMFAIVFGLVDELVWVFPVLQTDDLSLIMSSKKLKSSCQFPSAKKHHSGKSREEKFQKTSFRTRLMR